MEVKIAKRGSSFFSDFFDNMYTLGIALFAVELHKCEIYNWRSLAHRRFSGKGLGRQRMGDRPGLERLQQQWAAL